MSLDVSGCLNHYDSGGVRFDYPDVWDLHEDQEPDGDRIITVSTEGTCFWVLRVLTGRPAAKDVVEACIAAFREEFEDIEESSDSIQLAALPAYSRQLEFSCMELINSVSLACVRGSQYSLLVWWQGTDHELTDVRPVFEQMTRSVQFSR